MPWILKLNSRTGPERIPVTRVETRPGGLLGFETAQDHKGLPSAYLKKLEHGDYAFLEWHDDQIGA